MTVVLYCSLVRRLRPRSLAYQVCGCPTTPTQIHQPQTQKRHSHTSYFTHGIISSTQQVLETAHNVSGMPWWLMVVAGTVVIRTALTAPFDVWQAKAVAKLQVVKPALSEAESGEFKEPMDKAVSKAHGVSSHYLFLNLRNHAFK